MLLTFLNILFKSSLSALLIVLCHAIVYANTDHNNDSCYSKKRAFLLVMILIEVHNIIGVAARAEHAQ